MKKINYKKGFTLTELLIVIAMIGILATVVYASLAGARQKSEDAKKVAELKVLEQAVEAYFQENYKFPLNFTDLSTFYNGSDWTEILSMKNAGDLDYKTNSKTYCLGVKLKQLVSSGVCPITNPSVDIPSISTASHYSIIPGPNIP